MRRHIANLVVSAAAALAIGAGAAGTVELLVSPHAAQQQLADDTGPTTPPPGTSALQ